MWRPPLTSIHALHAQALWETEGTRRAVHRYREAALSKEPHELPGGRRLLRECVPNLVTAIRLGQDEAKGLLAAEGRTPLWAWPLMVCDAEEIAVITICTTLRSVGCAVTDGNRAGTAVATCTMIARVAQEQLGFGVWVEEQKKLNKIAKEAKGDPEAEPHKDLLAALRNRHPDIDRRTWAKWRRKLEITKADPWDKAVSLAFGGWLLEALERTSEGRIKVAQRPISGGRTEAYVALSAETEELLRDLESRAEVARPLRMPMLIPPIPWAYETKA